MWEITLGVPPFSNRGHDLQLGLNICKGERPEIIKNTHKNIWITKLLLKNKKVVTHHGNCPQSYVDLMKKCWDTDPIKQPKTSEIKNIIDNWWSYYNVIINVDKKLENNFGRRMKF